MKKAAAALFAVIAIFSCILPAYARVRAVDADGAVTIFDRIREFEEHFDVNALTAYLEGHFINCEDEIDISGFEIPQEYKYGLFYLIWKGMPRLFHVYGLGAVTEGKILSAINVTYTMSPDEYAAALTEFDACAKELLDGVSGSDRLTDAQKALILHDRLAARVRYDNTLSKMTAYDAIVGRCAVCEGYTKAYMHLLSRVGIKSYYCASNDLYHAWNIVMIDGKAYHTDVTWDSFSDCITGCVTHDYFLLSTDKLAADHIARDFEILPTDKTYEADGLFWKRSQSEIILLDGEIYYIDNEAEKLIRLGDGAQLADLSGKWKIAGTDSYYSDNHSRLCTDGEYLYYSLPDSVYLYDPHGYVLPVYTNALPEGDNIYGLGYENGELIIEHNTEMLYDLTMPTEHQIGVPYSPPASTDSVTLEPTCVEPGVLTHTCGVCGKTSTEPIPALGHDLVHHGAKAPTLTEPGYEAYDVCTRCGYNTYVEIPPPQNGVSVAAAQISQDGGSIRFVAAVDSLEYAFVGFEISVTNAEDRTETVTAADRAVYKSLEFNGISLTSEDFGIADGYLFVLVINNVPSTLTVSVTPFAADAGGQTEDRISAPQSRRFDIADGRFCLTNA